MSRYEIRDIISLDKKGGYYFRHVDAMTGEKLHSKSDIAAELGHRDMLIDTYRDLCGELLKTMKKAVKMWDDIYPDMESGKYPQERLEDAEFNEIGAMRTTITKAEEIMGGNTNG